MVEQIYPHSGRVIASEVNSDRQFYPAFVQKQSRVRLAASVAHICGCIVLIPERNASDFVLYVAVKLPIVY